MVLRAHREPGMDDRVPTMAQVFRMATIGGAKTTPFGARLGTLEVGKAADMVLIDWRQISYPYLDEETPVLDAIVQRAKTEGVKTVIARRRDHLSGRQVHEGRPRRRAEAVLGAPGAPVEPGRDRAAALSKAVFPHVKSFYEDYYSDDAHVPYYRQNSRV